MPISSLKRHHELGFTLVELVMVLVLIGILTSVALPKFAGRSSFDQRVFFDDTLNAFRYAQKAAVASGCNVQIAISANRYQLLRDDSCTSGNFSSNLAVTHPAHQEDYQGSLSNVSLTASNATTMFTPLGQADANNTITVAGRQITVVAATGFSYDSTP